MIGCLIQLRELDHIVPVCAVKSSFIYPQIVKQKLAQFLSAAAGRTGIEQIAYRFFGGGQKKTVSVFFAQPCSVGKSACWYIPVDLGAKRRFVLLLSSLSASGRSKGVNGFRYKIMPCQRKLKGKIGGAVDYTGQIVPGYRSVCFIQSLDDRHKLPVSRHTADLSGRVRVISQFL